MDILEKIKSGFTYFDGGMGTLMQELGLLPGEMPETWNITRPDVVTKLHADYLAAGCDILTASTFTLNRLKFPDADGDFSVENLVAEAVKNARAAVAQSGKDAFVALDLGPTGKLLKPYGDLDFEAAVDIFSQTVRAGAVCGVDLILIETMNDSYETKAAVLAAKENSDLPVFVTTVYDEKGKLLTGADPLTMVAMLEGLGADAIGVNCSLGPKQMKSIAGELCRYASVPVIVNPNAGLPRFENGKTVFDVSPEDFAETMVEIAENGARILGGCCGTTPAHIKAMIAALCGRAPKPVTEKNISVISSYCRAVSFGERPVLIGERINPTGKKRFKQALREHDMGYILQEGLSQQEKGVHVLDVNVGLPEIDEVEMMAEAVTQLQSVTDLPLQIDTADPAAMARAMRLYNGKPMLNSVNGKQESMELVFPLIKKYGGLVVALTLDEDGIPETAEGRMAIAEKISTTAETFGIKRKDIIIDPLAMAISSDSSGALATLDALKMIKDNGGLSSLGVSNISFGLPNRDFINSAFFAMALENGLSAAILNPSSQAMMSAYYSFCALKGLDVNCSQYIEYASSVTPLEIKNASPAISGASGEEKDPLIYAITNGLKEQAAAAAAAAISTEDSLAVIDGKIIPALDIIGNKFEKGAVFLPQLLMSAEAAQSAFDIIKQSLAKRGEVSEKKGKIVLATVRGDIHDIGKNIVKVLLENYGYEVIDLGKDVPVQAIVDTAIKENIKFVGLSALMTTTVPAMADTIKALRQNAPHCRVVVGGAVLTQEYADMIGADRYAKDAMEAVRYAEEIFGNR